MQTANGCRLCVQIKEERNKSHHPADLPPRFRTIRAQRQDPMGVERMFFNIHQCLPLKESSSQRFPRCKIRPSQCSRSWEGRMRSAHGADFPPRPGQLPDSPSPFKTHLGLVSRLRNFTQRPQAKTISSVIRTLLPPKVAARRSDFFLSFLLAGAALAKGGTRFPHLRRHDASPAALLIRLSPRRALPKASWKNRPGQALSPAEA